MCSSRVTSKVCAAPLELAQLQPVHDRPDQREFQPAADVPEPAGAAVDQAPLQLPDAEQVGGTDGFDGHQPE